MVAGEKTRPASSGANRSILIVEHEKGQKEACCLAAYLPNSPKAHDQSGYVGTVEDDLH